MIVGALAAPLALADSAADAWQAIADAASALSSGSAPEFLAAFDSAMPGFEILRRNVTALVQQNDLQSGIEPVTNEGSGEARALELDWQLQLTSHEEPPRVVQRHETVKCRLEKRGRKWRIVSFEPAALFAPPGA